MTDVGTQDKAEAKAEAKTETKFDGEAFAMNIARAMETSGQALAAYLKPRQTGEVIQMPAKEAA